MPLVRAARCSRRGGAVVAGTKVDGRQYLKFTLLNPETTLDDIARRARPDPRAAAALVEGDDLVAAAERARDATMIHDFIGIGLGPVQPRPRLPDRADRRPRRGLPGAQPTTSTGTPGCSSRAPPPDAVHGGPGDPGRPDLAVLLPQLPEGTGPAVLVLHPRELLPAAHRVQRLLPLGRRAARPAVRPARRSGVDARRATRCTSCTTDGRRDVPRPARWCSAPAPPYVPEACRGLDGDLRRTLPTTWSTRTALRRRSRSPSSAAGRAPPRSTTTCSPRSTPRLPAELGHPLAAVLPAGVHQAHAGDDLARSTWTTSTRCPTETRYRLGRAEGPLQGHQRRPDRRDLRPALPEEPSTARCRPGCSPTPRCAARRTTTAAAYTLGLRQDEQGQDFELRTEAWSWPPATATSVPEFLEPRPRPDPLGRPGRFDVARNYTIDTPGGEIFLQNAEEHTHGFASPDLGMGAYRNSYIIASSCSAASTTRSRSHRLPGVRRARTCASGGGPMSVRDPRPSTAPRDAELLHGWVTHPRPRSG